MHSKSKSLIALTIHKIIFISLIPVKLNVINDPIELMEFYKFVPPHVSNMTALVNDLVNPFIKTNSLLWSDDEARRPSFGSRCKGVPPRA